MDLSPPTRTALRTTARLSALATAINSLAPTVAFLIYDLATSGWGYLLPLTVISPLVLTMVVLAPALSVAVFWASGDERHRRVALWCVALLLLAYLGVAGYTAVSNYAHTSGMTVALWSNVINTLYPVTLLAYLLLSYRGPARTTIGPASPRRSGWAWLIAPLILIALLTGTAAVFAIAEQSLRLLYLLTAGLLYGWMRQRQPMPGSTSWHTVTLLLVLPAIPDYLFDLLATTTADVPLLLPWAGPLSIGVTVAVSIAVGALIVRVFTARPAACGE